MFQRLAFLIPQGDEASTVVVADFVNRRSRDAARILSKNEKVSIGGAGPIGAIFVPLGLSLLPPEAQA